MEKYEEIPFPLMSIQVSNFRGLNNCSLENLGKLNILVGKNNVGKSSFLEAIYMGYSFFGNKVLTNFNRRGEKYPTCIEYLFNKKPEIIKIDLLSMHSSLNIAVNKVERVDSNIYDNWGVDFQKGMFFITNLSHKFGDTSTHARKTFALNEKMEITGLISNGNHNLINSEIKITLIDSKFDLDMLIDNYSEVVKNNKIKDLINILSPIFQIDDIRIIKEEGNTILYIEINKEYLPISSYGEGLKWSILLTSNMLMLDKGIILIDDIENFHHPSSLKNIIKSIINLTYNNNVQVFLTTHSLECIDMILDEAENMKADLKLIYINKLKNVIKTNTYSLNEALESRNLIGTDLRGL